MKTHEDLKDRLEAGLAVPSEPHTRLNVQNGAVGTPRPTCREGGFPFRQSALRLPSSVFCLLSSLLCALALHADPLDTWHVRGPGPTTNQFNAVAWGGSGFVAAGNAGTLAASPDGYKWELLNIGVATNIYGAAWGDGAYVVVGDGGVIFTSPNGVEWTARESGTTASLRAITFGTNAFVAVGADHTLLTSTNQGRAWRIADGINVGTLNTVLYDAGLFVAVGTRGGIVTSPDGLEWTAHSAGATPDLHLLVYENGTFVAYSNTTDTLYSTNGSDWAVRWDASGIYMTGVAAGNGVFVGVGDYTALFWAYTTDYIWNAYLKATRSRLLAVAFGNGFFAYVGEGGTIEIGDGLFTTMFPPTEIWCGEWPWSGEDLSTVMRPTDQSWWPGTRFWAGNVNGGTYLSSTNGVWYASQGSAPVWGWIGGMAASSKLIVAVDSKGIVATSTDTKAYGVWNRTDPGFGPLRGVVYGRDRFVAVGDTGTVITSTNGSNWTKLEGGTQTNLWTIAFLNDQFVAAGEKTVITSPDGLAWAVHGAEANLRGVTFKHGLYAAVGLEGKILTSTDTVEWTSQTSGTTNDLYAISHDTHQFVAVGNSATILTGRDGTNWTVRTSPRKVALRGVAFGDGTFVAVGDRWTVLESDPIPQGPCFGPVTLLEGGQLQLSIEDIDPGQFEIQISPDLTAWSSWTNVTAIESRVLVIDPEFTQTGQRFYRAVVK